MTQKFFVTTPIYYANGIPHLGNAYASFIADVLARYKRLLGYEVKFATGTDENGQKMTESAAKERMEVMPFLDKIAGEHKALRDALEITYTDFIRTTEERHKVFVQSVLQKTFDKGDIYLGDYIGLYCVGCEAFKKESDLVMDDIQRVLVCPDHRTPPQQIKEKNYFFKLSKYQSWLENFFKSNPTFLVPQYRYNEMLSFLEKGLEDFSISREGSTFGIPLPFDPSHVTYIRYDALLNYLTVCQGGDEEYGKNMTHVLGKDIARFHSIFWPAMLAAADMEDFIPKKEFINGFFTVDGMKMGKSLGNTIDPLKTVHEYDRDALVFYLLYDIPVGADGDFSWERFNSVYESMLIGGRGNLVSRVTKLGEKYEIKKAVFHQDIQNTRFEDEENVFLKKNNIGSLIENNIASCQITELLRNRYDLVKKANKCIQETAPRELAKQGKQDEANKIVEHLLYVVRTLALIAAPVLTNSFRKMQAILGNKELAAVDMVHNSGVEAFKLLEEKEFDVELKPDHLYVRKDNSKPES